MSEGEERAAHPVMSALAGIEEALSSCADAPLYELPDRDVEEALVKAHKLVARLQGTLVLPLAREGERRGLPAAFDAPSAAVWLRDLLRMAPADAKQLATLAAAVEDDYAATGRAMAAGRVSLRHAAAVRRAVEAIPPEAPAGARAKAEATLLELSAEHDPQTLAGLGRRILEHLAPDAADEILRKQLEREERAAAKAAELRLMPEGDGRVRLAGWLDTEGAQLLRAALGPLAKPRPAGPDGRDPRDHAHRMADALVELARRALRQGDLPEHGGQPPTLVLGLDYGKLAADLGAADLDTGERLSASAARRLACDALIIPAVLGGASQPLDLGRAQRTITGPLRRALIIRDKGCAFPHCDRPPEWCDGHHIIHWADGGHTSLSNAVLLCRHHHTAIHHREWEVRISADGVPEFIPPPRIDPERKPIRNRFHRAGSG